MDNSFVLFLCIHSDLPWAVSLWEQRAHTKHRLPMGLTFPWAKGLVEPQLL